MFHLLNLNDMVMILPLSLIHAWLWLAGPPYRDKKKDGSFKFVQPKKKPIIRPSFETGKHTGKQGKSS